MDNKKILEAFERQNKEYYYTPKIIKYGVEPGIFLSPFEFDKLIEYRENIVKEDDKQNVLLPLLAFDNKCLYYSMCRELSAALGNYAQLAVEDEDLSNRFSSDFVESRIYSEIEGTLNVENVPTTRRRLKELLEDNAPIQSQNDIIIKNMKSAMDFVNDMPIFNKDNLFKLYSLLSHDCLDEEDKLRPGDYYRYDSVEISRYHGCPATSIDECMNSLFSFVNEKLDSKHLDDLILLPHIAHYYIVYIHPYFDYNGRTARMVSYWIYLLLNRITFPPIVSEAINQTKNKYYEALELTRDTHNDLTYFLLYIFNISNEYIMTYLNLKHYNQMLKDKGHILTSTELNYIKRILISNKGAFSYSDFLKMANVEMSKQGALKTLNRFVEYQILVEVDTKSKTKLFNVNKSKLLYSFSKL